MPQSLLIDKLIVKDGLKFTIPIAVKRYSRATNTSSAATPAQPTTPLQRALIRGHQWLNQLETGKATSFREIAKQNNTDERYVSRMINLTRLAPSIVSQILDDTLPNHMTIAMLTRNTPRLWQEQHQRFCIGSANKYTH